MSEELVQRPEVLVGRVVSNDRRTSKALDRHTMAIAARTQVDMALIQAEATKGVFAMMNAAYVNDIRRMLAKGDEECNGALIDIQLTVNAAIKRRLMGF